MNPKKISLFIIITLAFLFALTFLSNIHKSNLGTFEEGFSVAGWIIKYPTANFLLHTKKKDDKKVEEIISEIRVLNEEEQLQIEQERKDSLLFAENKHKIELNTNVEGKIYYPEKTTDFITQLKEKLNQPICQIVHYGDSQIEGDRITSYIRNRFQILYGGGGPGFFPIKVAYDQKSIDIETSLNWFRYAAFDRKQEFLPHGKYGLYGSLSRFTKYREKPTDSIEWKYVPVEKASFTIKPSLKFYNRLRSFTEMSIHYGNCTERTLITVYENGVILLRDSLFTDGKYHNFKIRFEQQPKEIMVELESKISPDFYGVTLDEPLGVRVDNVAMRGEAGRFFMQTNQKTFQQMSAERKPDIIIFQYGGNTIPYIYEEKQVTGYVKTLIRNIKWVQKSSPNAVCMLIGPGDMSTSINGEMVTYPFLLSLNEEMKKQCLKNGIAYWSLFEAMGGENSMPLWVEKGIASPDYVHLRPEGTQLIAELLFQCFHDDLLAVE